MNEINEQTENMKQIQEALATPTGSAADFNEDELEAKLEELEGAELEEQLLQPATSAPAAPVQIPQVSVWSDQPLRRQRRRTISLHCKPRWLSDQELPQNDWTPWASAT